MLSVIHELHGDRRHDPYFGFREKSNPAVLAHLAAENARTDAALAPTLPLQEQLYSEILGRIQETDSSVPVRRSGWDYYVRTEQGLAYPIYCRSGNTILDANLLAAGHDYFRLGVFEASPNHQLLAYSTDYVGDEKYTLVFLNLATHQLLPDSIPDTHADLVWANDNQTVFYTKLDPVTLRPYQVWRHSLGNPNDFLVFEEPDERFLLSLDKSRDEQIIFLHIDSSTSSEVYFLSAHSPFEPLTIIAPRRPDVEYSVGHRDGNFLIRTNLEATNFRLVQAPVSAPGEWFELVAHRPEIYLENFAEFAEHLVLYERTNGLRQINIDQTHLIPVPEPVYHLTTQSNPNFDTHLFRYAYTSLTTPTTVYDYDMNSRQLTQLKQESVLGGYNPTDYTTERLWATAPDGTRLPIALVYKTAHFKKDGQSPVLLYGYGSYGINIEAVFKSDRLSLLDRGFAYAIATIRGGSEMGRPWYDHGKFLEKKNTFTDFIAAAEHLIACGYTSPAHLAIEGRSAGGLLIGAVLNMRPDLFAAAHAGVPFVDVLSTMLDETLPLTVGEYEEWGDPHDETYYHYMKSYSPYDNVTSQAYPNLLITSGLNDPRVQYWEPTKWAARLRELRTNDNLLLLKTNMGAGHFGKSGRYDALRETALYYAFFLHALNLM